MNVAHTIYPYFVILGMLQCILTLAIVVYLLRAFCIKVHLSRFSLSILFVIMVSQLVSSYGLFSFRRDMAVNCYLRFRLIFTFTIILTVSVGLSISKVYHFNMCEISNFSRTRILTNEATKRKRVIYFVISMALLIVSAVVYIVFTSYFVYHQLYHNLQTIQEFYDWLAVPFTLLPGILLIRGYVKLHHSKAVASEAGQFHNGVFIVLLILHTILLVVMLVRAPDIFRQDMFLAMLYSELSCKLLLNFFFTYILLKFELYDFTLRTVVK